MDIQKTFQAGTNPDQPTLIVAVAALEEQGYASKSVSGDIVGDRHLEATNLKAHRSKQQRKS